MFDITPFLKSNDPFYDLTPPDVFRDIYDFKYRVAALLKPKTILEIGVRAGYSAAAFLSACPTASYLGLDADVNRYGGIPGFLGHARATLPARFPKADITIKTVDTQQPLPFRLPPVDLAHVDGDHSEEGCLRDLRLVSLGSDWILVDDIDHHPEVRRAVNRFMYETNSPGVYFPTLRGDTLIQVRK